MSENEECLDALFRLQQWYSSHCDGDWEHTYGVQIDTLDNPGWSLKVDLAGTELECIEFTPVLVGVSEDMAIQGGDGEASWYVCKVTDIQFVSIGGPHNLIDMIEMFLKWAKANRGMAT